MLSFGVAGCDFKHDSAVFITLQVFFRLGIYVQNQTPQTIRDINH